MKRHTILVSMVGGLALVGGAAAAGALPGAASPTANEHVTDAATTGEPNENAGTHPDTRGLSADAVGHGAEVSELARTTTATGVDKGAAVSALASDGKSQAGQHGANATLSASAVVDAPNDGGTGTADTASGDTSVVGTGTASTASDGHSAAGSANAAAGLAHKP